MTNATIEAAAAATVTDAPTPTDRLLTGALLVAPLIYLAADSTYAARGWDDGVAGVIHVLGAIGYGFVVLRFASWLPRASRLAAAILFTGLIGMAGNVAYGFEAIHMSFGDTALVDRSGTAILIKPHGLFFPLSIALIAIALRRLEHRWQGIVVLMARSPGRLVTLATSLVSPCPRTWRWWSPLAACSGRSRDGMCTPLSRSVSPFVGRSNI